FVQMGFGTSQVLGIPIGLYLAGIWSWEAPFWMIAGLATIVAVIILVKLQPVTAHLGVKRKDSVIKHLWKAVVKKRHRTAFTSTALLSIGGFMMMPFASAFAINNLHVTNQELPVLFMVSGVSSLLIMPMIGRLSDKIDKFKIFMIASIWMMLMCVVYTNLSVTPFWIVVGLNVLLMMGIMSRVIPSSALTSAVPDMEDRGAFMSVNSSLQQIAGGVAATVSGLIVVQKTSTSPLENYNIVGYVLVFISLLSIALMYRVSVLVNPAKSSL
ncbi:MFS transporter, partial [Pedobacter sp.]|uniref:MFS transporter n=1 Tax=Pedobacter sp. TaxID=1411316 RepID=UPI003D7FAADE